MEKNTSVTVFYGTRWCPDCHRARKILDRFQIRYQWIDIDKDLDGRAVVEKINHGNRSVPTLIFPDGSILVEPKRAELIEYLEEHREDHPK